MTGTGWLPGRANALFDPQSLPRVFAIAPGADFSRQFCRGLVERATTVDPFALARTQVLVNTRRTGGRMAELLAAEGARLLPRIRPVADLGLEPVAGLPPPVAGLRRRLELSRLVRALLEAQPELGPRAAAFDLAASLARLIDEMHEEGVLPEALVMQDFGELSGHWQRSARLLAIAGHYFGPGGLADLTAAARLDLQVGRLAERWQSEPPETPVIVAGSTGSRGTTFRLMLAVARLPQGALVLPGFDLGESPALWQRLLADRAEDHPQYRFARLLHELGLDPSEIPPWTGGAAVTPRNRLISLALRPAPVSDQWIVEGPALGDLGPATDGMSLIEAPTPRIEALAIALALREAVGRGEMAAVVTPDRALTRHIAAELDRWGIAADDSAGEPLALTAQGRLLRHAARLMAAPARIETALVVLKHPLVHAAEGRGRHLQRTRELELRLRRAGRPLPGPEELVRLIGGGPGDQQDWALWVTRCLAAQAPPGARRLADHVAAHLALLETLSRGLARGETVPLWQGRAGRAAQDALAGLARESDAAGPLNPSDYCDLVEDLLARAEVRAEAEAHTGVRFWGTIEARIQGADLMVLAGLVEGSWPARPAPDPWLNRRMRRAVGLTLPERRIGLSAHDFQQAATAPQVILSRSLHDGSAETVPARWLGRLTNLLAGLPETGVPALAAMRGRGHRWLDLAARMDLPGRHERQPAAPRPAPAPPVPARPTRLSVTEIQTLIRDPYAIYARHVLRLLPLNPLRPAPDALAQGVLVHSVMERFLKATRGEAALVTPEALLAAGEAALAESAPWPGARHIWRGRLHALADWVVADERARRETSSPVLVEAQGAWQVPGTGMTLVGRPDRIDLDRDGLASIVDYKTGGAPSARTIRHFDRQLLLLALMAEGGAFGRPLRVGRVEHVALGSKPELVPLSLDSYPLAGVLQELRALLAAYADPDRGYAARRAQEGLRWSGDYDHLARYGEWAASDPVQPERME